ncbi:MAG: hypothetical protein ACOYPR_23075 [Saprospiraceae bacterium]
MKYILANQWLRNISLLGLILLVLHLSDPQPLTVQENLIALSFFSLVYAACWANNRLLYHYFLPKSSMWMYALFLIPILSIMSFTEHWAYDQLPVPTDEPWTLANSLISCSVFLLIGFGIHAAYREIMRQQSVLEQELLTKRNELRFLQNQVNPLKV